MITFIIVAIPILIYASDENEDIVATGMNLFNSSFSGSGIDIIIPVLIAIIVCRDFTSESIRLIVGRGYSKTKIYANRSYYSGGCFDMVCYHRFSMVCFILWGRFIKVCKE